MYSVTIPDPESTAVTIPAVLSRFPRAHLLAGELCAHGAATAVGDYELMLSIDSVTPTVSGRWAIGYYATIQTEYGAFAAVPVGSTLQVTLASDPGSASCAFPYVLSASLIGDSIASASLQGGCIAPASALSLYAGDVPGLP